MHQLNEDILLIKEILSGNKKSFRLLYNKYGKFFLITCLRYVNDQSSAQDLVQESFIKIFNKLKSFDENKGNFISWSKRIVINECLMYIRKNNILRDSENIIDLQHKFSVEACAIDQLNLEDLTKLISQLPNGYRTVFNMFVIDGFSHKEISEKLKISVSTSKTQLLKARKLLQNNLTKTEYNLEEYYAS